MSTALAAPLTLAARTDIAALGERFRAAGRVQVPGLLETRDAEAAERALRSETDWRTVLNHGARHIDLHAVQLAALDPRGRETFASAVAGGAVRGFQYNYDNFPLYDAAREGAALAPGLRSLHDFIAGRAFLDFARALTGDARIAFADMQATRYRAGHFLTTHDDGIEGKNRLYAYVFNLTREWRADWGGLLLFYDADGNVEGGFTPAFNVLNIFRVPQAHGVSMVAPFAQQARYAITGWLRSGQE